MFEAFSLTLNPWLPVGVLSSTFLLIPESQLPPATRLPVPNPARIELLGWTLTATPRQVERVTQLFWESANAASPDLFQQVTSQLLALFRAQGCALPVAEELAQKVTGELTARVREVLRQPGLGASWISGVIHVGDLKLSSRPTVSIQDLLAA